MKEKFPDTIPIFPLDGVIYFPKTTKLSKKPWDHQKPQIGKKSKCPKTFALSNPQNEILQKNLLWIVHLILVWSNVVNKVWIEYLISQSWWPIDEEFRDHIWNKDEVEYDTYHFMPVKLHFFVRPFELKYVTQSFREQIYSMSAFLEVVWLNYWFQCWEILFFC